MFDRSLDEARVRVIRVAEGLAQNGHRVTVAQCGRLWPSRSPGGVSYVPFDYYGRWDHLPNAEAVVVLTQPKVLARTRKRFRDARLVLWAEGVPGSKRRGLGRAAAEAGATVVCGSDVQHAAVREVFAETDAWAPTARIHSPIDDALAPDGTPVDPDKLVVVAGPRDGLAEVLDAFRRVRAVRPSARLHVVDPAGERGDRLALTPGVVSLGPLPHREVIRHVRQAFAVFHPQTLSAGGSVLGFARANAVGTPVLAHPHPAVREVLAETPGEGRQLVDARNPGAAARRLAQWWDEGRPVVTGSRERQTSRVVSDWERLLDVTPSRPHVRRVATPMAAAA